MQPWHAILRAGAGRIVSTCALHATTCVLYALRAPAPVNRLDFHVRDSRSLHNFPKKPYKPRLLYTTLGHVAEPGTGVCSSTYPVTVGGNECEQTE